MKFNLITLLPLLAQVSAASDKTPFLRGLKSGQGGKPPGYEKAKEAKNKLKDDTLGLTGVVGTGIGADEDGTGNIKATVVVFLESQSDVAKVPTKIDGVKVKTVVSGAFSAYKKPAGNPGKGGGGGVQGGDQCDISYDQRRDWPWGASTFFEGVNSACTLGGTVYDNSGAQWALSCYHCFALDNSDRDIVVPGGLDGPKVDTIGTDLVKNALEWCEWTPQTWADVENFCNPNKADAAAVKVDSGVTVLDKPCQYLTAGTNDVNIGDEVKKVGRTTGFTSSRVDEIDADILVSYGYDSSGKERLAYFKNQIVIEDRKFSKPGDSGSTVQNSSGQTVGLLYAGSSRTTILNQINDVTAALQLSFN
jgi:hypothetical protein